MPLEGVHGDGQATGEMADRACKMCGDCCRDIEFVFHGDIGIDNREFMVARGCRVTVEGEDTIVSVPLPCPFLAGNRCSIYDQRPLVCRVTPCPKSDENL